MDQNSLLHRSGREKGTREINTPKMRKTTQLVAQLMEGKARGRYSLMIMTTG